MALSSSDAKLNEQSLKTDPRLREESSLATSKTLEGDSSAGIDKAYGNLPLSFEENLGQMEPSVKYVARGPGCAE